MRKSLITVFHESSRGVATIACFVTFTFVTMILAPTVAAAQEAVADANNAALIAGPVEAQFAEQMTELAERLKQWRSALEENSFTPANEADRGRSQMGQIQSRLAMLDLDVRASLRELGWALEQRNAPPVMLNRQQEQLQHYEQKYSELEGLLDGLNGALGAGEIAALDAVIEFLDKYPSQRAQRPFDPDELPFQNLQPLPDNLPGVTAEDFAAPDSARKTDKATSASVQADSGTGTAAAEVVASTGFNDPQWLAQSDEVVLTEAIRAKAAELNHDPLKIYHWVRNTIDWLPTWGAQQDADITLGSRRGNAFDQAALLIALLRASDIPARYVHGTIEVDADTFRNWGGGFDDINSALTFASSGGIRVLGLTSGGQVTKVRLEHIWVEAGLDYEPSSGARPIEPDNWVPMDPSFKQYEFLEGLDPIAISGLDPEQLAQTFVDSGTVNQEESWVTGFDPQILQDAQQQIQSQLEQFIQDNINDPTVGDVIGGRKVIVQEYPVVPSSLPFEVFVAGSRFASVPSALQQKITLGFGIGLEGFPIEPITIPWAKVNNHKLTISFTPASDADAEALAALIPADADSIDDLPSSIPSLIRVVPEIKLDGQTIHTGTGSLKLGEELTLFNQVFFPGRGASTRPLSVIAGSYMAIGSESGSISSQNLQQLRQKVEQTKATLETQDPALISLLGREDILGDLFHAGIQGYYAQYTALGSLMGLQSDGQMLLMAGMGTFGYEPRVNTLFGFPRSISPGGVALDIPIVGVQITDGLGPEKNAQFNQQIGLLSSALEHATPEQMFSTADQPADAISAVKALSKANAQGQRIYQLNRDNMAATLPNLNLAFETEREIEQALRAGWEVIAHTDNVSVPGWTGAGYIILDPETGSGAYKISGGASGSYLKILSFFLSIVVTILAILVGFGIVLSGAFIFSLALIALTSGFIAFIDRLECFGVSGDIAIEAFLAVSVISLIPGAEGINALRFFLAGFIGTNSVSAAAIAACETHQ